MKDGKERPEEENKITMGGNEKQKLKRKGRMKEIIKRKTG
jgi:hypothetical protein